MSTIAMPLPLSNGLIMTFLFLNSVLIATLSACDMFLFDVLEGQIYDFYFDCFDVVF